MDYRNANPWLTNDSAGPADDAFAITPSDTVNFAVPTRAIYSGAGGNITVVTPSGSAVLFVGVPAGVILPIRATRVNATGTAATSLVGLL